MSTKTIGFPANPSVDDEHQGWIWDGDKWVSTAVDGGGSIQDGDTQGQITTWDTSSGEWTPEGAVVVDADGNVGIGTKNPGSLLDVVNASGSAEIQIRAVGASAGAKLSLLGRDSSAVNNEFSLESVDGALRIDNEGAERLRIEAEGNVRMLSNRLRIYKDSSGGEVALSFKKKDATESIRIYSDESANLNFWDSVNGILRAKMDVSGNMTVHGTVTANGVLLGGGGGGGLPDGDYTHNGKITATDFISTSDERLKDNITPIPVGLIDDIKPVSWEWKDGSGTSAGVVAQQLQSAGLGDYVHENEDGQLGVNYQALTAILLAEVINLKAEVEALK